MFADGQADERRGTRSCALRYVQGVDAGSSRSRARAERSAYVLRLFDLANQTLTFGPRNSDRAKSSQARTPVGPISPAIAECATPTSGVARSVCRGPFLNQHRHRA